MVVSDDWRVIMSYNVMCEKGDVIVSSNVRLAFVA